MHSLRKSVDGFLDSELYESLMIFINVGLHYVSNPIPHFSRSDYRTQITEALKYLNDKSLNNKNKKKIRIIWRET